MKRYIHHFLHVSVGPPLRCGFFALLSLWLLSGLGLGCSTKPVLADISGEVFGTAYSVQYWSVGKVDPAVIEAATASHLQAVNAELSNWNPDSWVSQFNASAAGQRMQVPAHARAVLECALQLAELSGGALDPTISPLVELWGFGVNSEVPGVPSAEAIESALAAVGYGKLDYDRERSSLSKSHDAIALNLSAVAKGYAVDVLVDYLEREGIENYLVNIGGEIRASGTRMDGDLWQIGIARPLTGRLTQSHGLVVALADCALATSGNYQRFFDNAGTRYSHLLDPRSGMAVSHNVLSVSVRAPQCAWADGLATACFVLGVEEGMALVERLPDVEALFIIENEVSIRSSGWSAE